jgi:hypothetical protein
MAFKVQISQIYTFLCGFGPSKENDAVLWLGLQNAME